MVPRVFPITHVAFYLCSCALGNPRGYISPVDPYGSFPHLRGYVPFLEKKKSSIVAVVERE